MTIKEEALNNYGFGFCRSFMSKCFNPGSREDKAEKFDFKTCEEMMKQFGAGNAGRFDLEAFRSKVEQCCKRAEGKEKS